MSEARDNSPGATGGTDIGARATDFLQRRRYWKWSEENQAELNAWLDASLAHQVAFLRLEAGLGRAERLVALRPGGGTSGRTWNLPILIKSAVGALAVGVLAISIALYLSRPHGRTYATAIGGHEIVTLGDGSKIELNTNTVVRADVDAIHRTASIERGEAYFQIAHDENSPFVVTVGAHRITVLGTKFSVRADAGKTEIVLFEGRVWFSEGHNSTPEHTALLTPGDVLVATANTTSITKKGERDLSKTISWRHDVLIFGNTTLAEAASEFNRYNREQIIITDPNTARLRVGGTFQSKHVEDFTHLVRVVLGLHVERRADEIVISR